MAIWSFGSFVSRLNGYPGPLFWNRVQCVGLISMPMFFYHFTLVLTGTLNQKKKLYFGYCFAVFLVICNFLGLIVSQGYGKDTVFYYTLGPAAGLLGIWSFGYLILALVNILVKVKSGEMPLARVKFIIVGLGLVIIGGLLDLIPALGRYPIDIACGTVNAFLIMHSIYRYKFLEIKLIVRKGISYSLFPLGLAAGYIITIFSTQYLLSTLFKLDTIASALILSFLLALISHPLRNFIQYWVNFIFYKDKINHQKLLKEFSKVINNVLNLDELADTLLKTIEKVLRPKKIALFLRKDKGEYHCFKSAGEPNWCSDLKLRDTQRLTAWFSSGKYLLTIQEIQAPSFTELGSSVKDQLRRLGVELMIPITLREQLIGFIIISEKRGGEAYAQDELELMPPLLNSSAVVIENAQLYEAARQQAITDGLTKLYNHRHFHELLKEYEEKKNGIFSIALIDVDFFKIYNDLYGHSAGDRALAKIAEIMKLCIGDKGLTARYGGEEFSLLLPGFEGGEAMKLVEQLRKSVESSFVSSSDSSEFLTVSIGVACFPRHSTNSDQVLKYADSAMYEAKKNGKNQCMLYSARIEENTEDDPEKLPEMQDSIKEAYLASTYALAATIDAKDHYTYGHSENVSRYAVQLAIAAGFDDETIEIIKNAGLLHDIGKVGVPENILTKTSSLTREEYDIMKRHVDISISIIKHVPNLIKLIPAIMSHHERYDGKGYPRSIKGENIPIEGRCLCIVDAFDAMTSDRPYRKGLSPELAIEELKKNSGTQFDPKLDEIFIKIFEEGKIKLNP